MNEDLYISLTVAKTRSIGPYEWRIFLYSEWRSQAGMNMTNSSWDTMAAAWAGGAYLYRQVGSGQYINGNFDLCKEPLDEWPSDGAPNTGTAWSFHEWRPGFFVCPMNWGLIDVRIRTDSLVGRTDNVVYKYYHTFGGLQYDFTFSRTPSINVTPTNEQWALVLFGTYTHDAPRLRRPAAGVRDHPGAARREGGRQSRRARRVDGDVRRRCAHRRQRCRSRRVPIGDGIDMDRRNGGRGQRRRHVSPSRWPEGETGEAWNSFFFGTAPEGASRVVVAGPGTAGGHVTDGAWVIALRREGVSPAGLQWQVVDATGDVMESGSGITP